MNICPCKYPLYVLDKRDGDDIEYLSFPVDILEDKESIHVPGIEIIDEEGFDNKIHTYVAVLWKDPLNATIKKYDINDHIVIAGCNASVVNGGKHLQCREKELYVVLHPLDEWIKYHIVEL